MRPYIGQGIPTYTIFSTMGLFFMMMVIYLRNKIFDFLEYLEFIAILAIGAGIGSKVLFIITQIPDIVEHFSLRYMCYKVVTSGFVFYGGLIGAIEGTILFAHIKQLPKKEVLQLATPGYSIFHAVGRIGCFFAGCCYGKVTSWGFALWNEPGVKRIPVQLIESVYLFILTIILLKNENKWRDKIFEDCYSLKFIKEKIEKIIDEYGLDKDTYDKFKEVVNKKLNEDILIVKEIEDIEKIENRIITIEKNLGLDLNGWKLEINRKKRIVYDALTDYTWGMQRKMDLHE